jgi:hypothetical protein
MISEPMAVALARRLAVNLHTARALVDKQFVSHFKARRGRLRRYDLTLTVLGQRWRRWARSLGYR